MKTPSNEFEGATRNPPLRGQDPTERDDRQVTLRLRLRAQAALLDFVGIRTRRNAKKYRTVGLPKGIASGRKRRVARTFESVEKAHFCPDPTPSLTGWATSTICCTRGLSTDQFVQEYFVLSHRVTSRQRRDRTRRNAED
jgi:hypothetical protein